MARYVHELLERGIWEEEVRLRRALCSCRYDFIAIVMHSQGIKHPAPETILGQLQL